MRFAMLISLLLLAGCTTPERCARRYPPEIIRHDSIVYKERIITIFDTVHIKGDTVRSADTVYIDRLTGLINSNRITQATEFAQAWAHVTNSRLFLELVQKDTAIARMLQENIKEVEVYRDRVEVVKTYSVHWYDIAARWMAGLFLLLVLIKLLL